MTAVGNKVVRQINVDGQEAVVTFEQFGLEEYALFLRCKSLPEYQVDYEPETDIYRVTTPARFASLLGAQDIRLASERLPPSPHLFDYQRWIVDMALDARRYACWTDTGLGKTHIFVEWARQVMAITDGRVLILSPLQVISQTRGLAGEYFGLEIPVIPTREELAEWCKTPGPGIAIATHHKMAPGIMPELRHLAGLVIDESSILKTGGGVIKWNLIKSARGIEYKLSCTATPAPNDAMEYASQAAFLEKLRTEADILWTYFSKDKYGEWRVKPHAREAFYRFMSTWSIYLRDPARFGFEDILAGLPPPDIREHEIKITPSQREWMYGFLTSSAKGMFNDRMGVQERSKLSQLAKGFLYDHAGGHRQAAMVDSQKPVFVADLVLQEVAEGRQCLVWTVFDEEGEIIADQLANAPFRVGVLTGSMTEKAREAVLQGFRSGALPVLISKAQLVGYGLNFQFCRSMVFSGFDDSFERLYQAIRRCYRFGQTETVRVHIPFIPELEGMIFENIQAKQRRFEEEVSMQEGFYRDVLGAKP